MIGFYLTVDKSANSDVKLLLRRYISPTDLDALGQQGLRLFDDRCLQVVQSNGYTMFSVGTLIYKNQWQKKALELIINDLNSERSVQQIMSGTRGQFCLVIHTGGKVFVITDKLGSFPVYKFEDGDTIQISNIFLPLAKLNTVTVNYQAFAEYLSFDYCFDCTFFNEIELLDKGSIYQFTPTLKVQVYDDFLSSIVFNKYKNLDEISHIAKETLIHNLSFLGSNDRIFTDLTGGFDTRTIATMLKSMNIDFETGICGEQILHESETAKEVAETLQVKHHSNIKITNKDLFKKIVNKHFEIGNGVPILYHSSELINYYEHIKQYFDIHITGFAGSQLFDQFLPRLSLFSPKLKHKHIFEKSFKFKNIFKSNLLTKTSYYETLSKKISKLLKQIGSDVHDEAASFFTLSTFNKYYHGSLAGTHNAIMPFYCPYLESNIVRAMGETSYKLKENRTIQRAMLTKLDQEVSMIMTTHGYNANLNLYDTKHPIKKSKEFIKKLARQAAYEIGFPLRIVRWAESLRGKMKPQADPAEFQRLFWVNEVNNTWSNNMEILELLDRAKLNKLLVSVPDAAKLKAKILHLNRVINECNPKL